MRFLGGPLDGQRHEGLAGREALVPQFEGRVFVGVTEDGSALYDYPVHVYEWAPDGYRYVDLRLPDAAE